MSGTPGTVGDLETTWKCRGIIKDQQSVLVTAVVEGDTADKPIQMWKGT
jgi:hypothetical protein